MPRKTLILTVCILILFGIGYWGYTVILASNKAVIRSELSDRSREFLLSQKGSESAELHDVRLDSARKGEQEFDSQRIQVAECYSLVIPFPITDSRQNDPCVYYGLIGSPRGHLTASLRQVGFQDVEESPDITLRRSKKDQYKEETVIVQQVKYLVFTDTQSGVEKSAFGMQGEKLFTLSLSLGGDDTVKTRQMKKILESLEFDGRR